MHKYYPTKCRFFNRCGGMRDCLINIPKIRKKSPDIDYRECSIYLGKISEGIKLSKLKRMKDKK